PRSDPSVLPSLSQPDSRIAPLVLTRSLGTCPTCDLSEPRLYRGELSLGLPRPEAIQSDMGNSRARQTGQYA
ncbi:hypothetical protein, partial [Limnobacter sp.]|uniref:hypothetical protein n=1 Tax=Limnobacter sp. TaxID=2003368 RepID=UPI00258A69B8